MPQISIITATFNAGATVADCLASVRNQQGVVVEHIVIDGASTDDTVEIVRQSGHVDRIISEPDNGIYDAMNKGIALASGDIVGILNGDDFYTSDRVLSTVVKTFQNNDIAACYGDLQYVDFTDTDKVVRHWQSGRFTGPKQFYNGWMPPHPTFFVRREVYEKYGLFNLELGSAADYEIMVRFLVKYRVKAEYIPEVLVRMRTGGVSNASVSNRLAANRMDRKAWQVNGLRPYPWTLWLKPIRKVGQWFVKTK
jgi:glycosyltransferase